MASMVTNPRKKEEYVDALLPLTRLTKAELMGMTIEKLKVVWAGLKPARKVQILPVGWKKADKLTLLQYYQDYMVDFYKMEPDGHWLHYTRDRLVVELQAYVDEAQSLVDVEAETAPLAPFCPECGLSMVERTCRLDGKKLWGCVRFPVCKGTLPVLTNKQPTAVVQKALKAKEEKQFREWLEKKNAGKERAKQSAPSSQGYKVAVPEDSEMDGLDFKVREYIKAAKAVSSAVTGSWEIASSDSEAVVLNPEEMEVIAMMRAEKAKVKTEK